MPSPPRRFRINAVSEMTGVPPATLRAWERRYGVPVPSRTASSYRLYSERDIEDIHRLRELCGQGMSASEAARVVLAEQGAAVAVANHDDPYQSTIDAILDAVDSFDPAQLDQQVQRALALGPASVVYERIFRPVMVEVGERWHSGQFSVAQEHLATEVLESATRRMLGLVQPPDSAREIVLGAFADDEHSMPIYGVALHLAGAGFRVVMLGPRTPPAAIGQAVRERSPGCVGLSVTIDAEPAAARELIEEYAREVGSTPWVVGGRGSESLRDVVEEHGGHVVNGDEARDFLQQLESALGATRRRLSNSPSKETP